MVKVLYKSNQTETIDDLKTGKNLNKPNVSLSNKRHKYSNKFQNIDFSSSKFLKGDPTYKYYES